MNELVIINGAQGVGKTTVSNILKKRLDVPVIHHDWLRRFHLDTKWSQASIKESQMAFDNLKYIIKNYFDNNYRTVIVDSVDGFQAAELLKAFPDARTKIFILIVNDNDELKSRVLSERDSGWTLADESIKINQDWASASSLPNALRIETSSMTAEQVADKIVDGLKT